MERINVTKTFLPPRSEYDKYLQIIWDNKQLTNQGPLLKQFEHEAEGYLGLSGLQFVANGTVALQLALQALDISSGEVITTPFSYVATTSAILWERCTPIYVDIDPKTLCIDPRKIEAAITERTKAILAVHVFGIPCDTERIEAIAKKHDLKVIYDGAHAFGVQHKGKSLLDYGDIATCSFHATKPFHTIEGGCVITKNKDIAGRIELMKRFGHDGDDHRMLGVNAKASEFQAAMGLCNLQYTNQIIKERKVVAELYDHLLLPGVVKRPQVPAEVEQNYAYYPVIFENGNHALNVKKTLELQGIFPRRYFYPSLNTLSYTESGERCPVSEQISVSILCLPLYSGLDTKTVTQIVEVVNA